jgi:hypothetical protein
LDFIEILSFLLYTNIVIFTFNCKNCCYTIKPNPTSCFAVSFKKFHFLTFLAWMTVFILEGDEVNRKLSKGGKGFEMVTNSPSLGTGRRRSPPVCNVGSDHPTEAKTFRKFPQSVTQLWLSFITQARGENRAFLGLRPCTLEFLSVRALLSPYKTAEEELLGLYRLCRSQDILKVSIGRNPALTFFHNSGTGKLGFSQT